MKKKLLLIASFLILIMVNDVLPENVYQLVIEESELTLEGTSTMHDWQMKSYDYSCTAHLDLDALNNKQIQKVLFKAKATKVLSEKKLMDKKAHKAMKANDHPEIEFVFESLESFEKAESEFNGNINGVLSLAGEQKNINIAFIGSQKGEGQIEVSGEIPLKMTDFGMKPPAFAFGAVKTGDEIIMKFQFILKKVN